MDNFSVSFGNAGTTEFKYYKIKITQAYFFTDFPATTETGISETLSLGKKFLSLAKKSLSKSKILQFDTFAGNSKSPLNRNKFNSLKNSKFQL